MRLDRNINVFSIFIVLEKERNLKLKELYDQRFCTSKSSFSSSTQQQSHQECNGALLPKLPPRYHNLEVSPELLLFKLRDQRPTSHVFGEYKSLDKVTKNFLHDTAKLLQSQCEEDAIVSSQHYSFNLSSLPAAVHRSSITITPPSSPSRIPRVTLTEDKPPDISLLKRPLDAIHEVDMTDEQIISLYVIAESSADAVVLNIL